MSRLWPFPGDRPVDRARQVCWQYRRALLAADPDTCSTLDRAAAAVGEAWVSEEASVETADDLVTAQRAADLVGRSVRWVYAWAGRNQDRVYGSRPILLRLGDVQEAAGFERGRRARAS